MSRKNIGKSSTRLAHCSFCTWSTNGQLYVALTRVRTRHDILILAPWRDPGTAARLALSAKEKTLLTTNNQNKNNNTQHPSSTNQINQVDKQISTTTNTNNEAAANTAVPLLVARRSNDTPHPLRIIFSEVLPAQTRNIIIRALIQQ